MSTDTDSREDRETVEMRDLATRVAEGLEDMANYSPEMGAPCDRYTVGPCDCPEYAPTVDDDGDITPVCEECAHEPADHIRGLPDELAELIDVDLFAEDPLTAIQDAYETWRDDYAAVGVLDISGTVSFTGGGLELQTLTAVLGTGGPHVEVTFDYAGRGHVRAYGWFGAGKTDVPVDIEGHPIGDMFDYFADMVGNR